MSNVEIDMAEIYEDALMSAIAALQALARGEAEILRDEQDQPNGVKWFRKDAGCWDECTWEN